VTAIRHATRGTNDPIASRVLVDGEARGASHGADVDEDGKGLLDYGRLYQLAREPGAVRDRTLEISFFEARVHAFAFTFGSVTGRCLVRPCSDPTANAGGSRRAELDHQRRRAELRRT
jgi:hypothetical protein